MSTSEIDLNRRGRNLEYLTVGWCIVEAGGSIWLGVAARSIALIAFGLDSVIEVFAALVVIWQLHGASDEKKKHALRLIAGSFFVLAAYILVESARDLITQLEPEKSVAGIVFLALSLVIMLLLAVGKWRVGKDLSNPVLLADAKESALCALLSVAALVGLALNAAMGWWWADPVAAIVVAGLAVKEGCEAWQCDE